MIIVLIYFYNFHKLIHFSKNKELTLEEFKFIWHMEYGHRMWGRVIGAAFLIPAIYFWSRGRFTSALKKRVIAFGGLIMAQVN